ncbi:hypothetical protein [Alteriqipengyuania lutimaris]|nr:hypothetical protein [Alteriqipengyuania lutimaris]MBB3034321.1 hypothetical protein [Alteriqipengyuania lutimaris]
MEPIAAQDETRGKDSLRRVRWAELSAAIGLSRDLRKGDEGLLSGAGPSFDSTDDGADVAADGKDERGINLSSLASRKAPGDTDIRSADDSPSRDREKR